MIKKLLATTLATLTIASMSLPAMAKNSDNKIADMTSSQTTQSTEENKPSHKSNNTVNEFNGTEKEDVKKYNTGELPLFESKEVKIDGTNGSFEFTELSANEEQRKAIDKENHKIKEAHEHNKSDGYLAIEQNIVSLHNNFIDAKDAIKEFNVATANSKIKAIIKNAKCIIRNIYRYPISGGLRYAYDNGILSKAWNYIEGKLSDKEDGKIATMFKWGKSVYNWYNGK